MLGSWHVVVEGFGMVSGKGNAKEGANILNVRIWVEGAVLEYEQRCVAKPPGKFSEETGHSFWRFDKKRTLTCNGLKKTGI